MMWINLPNRVGDTNLRIITVGIGNEVKAIRQHCVKPFFYNCFAITSGNSDDGKREFFAMRGRDFLHCRYTIFNLNKITISESGIICQWLCNHKLQNAFVNQTMNEPVSVVFFCDNGKKKRLFRLQKSATVKQ